MRAIAGFFFAATFLICSGCGPVASPGDRVVIDQSANFHRAVMPALLDSDASLNRYLQQIGDRIVAAAKDVHNDRGGPPSHFAEPSEWMFTKNIEFHLAAVKTINAFTIGGEHVYVYNGLFQRCNNEDDLAAVLAHEYAHIYSRHLDRKSTRLNSTH